MSANPPASSGLGTVWIPAAEGNFERGRVGYNILAIVNHIMAGSLVGTDAWFQNPTSKVSAHFGIGKAGQIHQYVQLTDTAYHAGVVNGATAKIIGENPGVNPNYFCIGIEHEGQSGDVLTEEQYQSSIFVHRMLIVKFGIPADWDHIIAHSTINSLHSGCPGIGFPWARLINDLDDFINDQAKVGGAILP